MSSTRSVKSLGVIANAATVGVPGTPVAGVAYRDPTVAAADLASGWKYGLPPNSASQNEWVYRMSSMLDIMDKQGVLGWCNLVDYAVPAVAFGSDGVLYRATAASGPSGAGAKDPTSNAAYWSPVVGRGSHTYAVTYGDGDWFWLDQPNGLFAQLIWGPTSTPGQTITLPYAFPTTCLWAALVDGGNNPLAWGPGTLARTGFAAYAGAGGGSVGTYRGIAIGY